MTKRRKRRRKKNLPKFKFEKANKEAKEMVDSFLQESADNLKAGFDSWDSDEEIIDFSWDNI